MARHEPNSLDDYALDIDLIEDLEAVGYGLPAPEACVSDEWGTVWF